MGNSRLDELFGSWDDSSVVITRKVPICLLLDCSGSMSERDGSRLTKIEEVNNNVANFIQFVRNDSRASKICDLCIISFAQEVKVECGYSSINDVKPPHLTAGGGTALGHAVDKAVQLLELRRKYYRENNIEHFKPIMLLMTDGQPTETVAFYTAVAERFAERVRKKEFKVFPVGIGKSFDIEILRMFSPLLEPKQIQSSEEFSHLFELLSGSSSKPEDDPLEKWWNEDI